MARSTHRIRRVTALTAFIILAGAALSGLFAQTVDPRYGQFVASADHYAVNGSGEPVVSGYQMGWYLSGASAPYSVLDLGKPTPDSTNTIKVDLYSYLVGTPLTGVTFTARVSALGPAGSASSSDSNPFTFSSSTPGQTVTDPRYGQFVASADHDAATSAGQPVVSGYQMGWYMPGATSPYSVLDLGKPTPDSANKITVDLYSYLVGTPMTGVTFTARVAAVGPTGSASSGDSNPFTFSGGCNYVVSPASASVANGGGTTVGSITTGPACAWSATSLVNWIAVSANQGIGSGAVTLTVSPNAAGTVRLGTLLIADHDVTITQDAAPCTLSVTPRNASMAATGGSGSTTITTPAGCGWTAGSSASWITLDAASGVGGESVGYSVAANTSTASRTGTVAVGGDTVTITQAGAACAYSVSPTSISAAAAGLTGSAAVTAQSGCTWTASSAASWISLAASNGSGAQSVGYTVAANTSTASRTGSVTIAGQAVSVTQAGQAPICSYAASVTSYAFGKNGGTGKLSLTTSSGCNWTATSNAAWLTVTPASGSGSRSVSFTASKNQGAARSARLTIGGQPVTVTQAKK